MLGGIIRGGEMSVWVESREGLWSGNFFNRSPITLKFEAEKIRERESQERESEREKEREREREQVVVFTFASCCSTLVSWHSILVICYLLVGCDFYALNLLFFTCV